LEGWKIGRLKVGRLKVGRLKVGRFVNITCNLLTCNLLTCNLITYNLITSCPTTFNPSIEARETLAACQTKLLGERASLGSPRVTSIDPLQEQSVLLLPVAG
jgi:hypothetical protein